MNPSDATKKQFDKIFQRQVVSCMLRLPTFRAVMLPIVKTEYFNGYLCDVVDFIQDYCADGYSNPIGRETIQDLLDSKKRAKNIYKVDVVDYEYVRDKAVDFCRMQAVKLAIVKCAETLRDPDTIDKINIVEEMQKALLVGADTLHLGSYLSDYESRIEMYLHPERKHFISTGMPLLDRALGGGMCAGELHVILAPPKCGKTFTLINIGARCVMHSANRERPLKIVHYSLEMSEDKILERYDTRINRYAEERGNVLASKDLNSNPKRYVENLRKLYKRTIAGNVIVKTYPTRSAGKSDFVAHLEQLKGEGYIPDLVICDYGDIMKAERRLGEMRHEKASCFEDLRTLAGEYGIPVVSASQCNRSAVDKKVINMNDLSESFEVSHVVDSLTAMCQTKDERADFKLRLHLCATRNGVAGTMLRCHIDLANAYISPYEIVMRETTEEVEDDKQSNKSKKEDGFEKQKKKIAKRKEAEKLYK